MDSLLGAVFLFAVCRGLFGPVIDHYAYRKKK